MFDLVLLEVKGFEVFTPFYIRGDSFQVLLGEVDSRGVVIHEVVGRAGCQ